MFSLAILIGVYSYLIFCLGLLGQFYKTNIIFLTLAFLAVLLVFYKNKIKFTLKFPKISFILLLILTLTLINFIGALGPELGFDALWYHLTLPKLYLLDHQVHHIDGGLLYYSDMPKLGEMIYAAALSFGNEILAKLMHFSFGVLTLIAIYKFSRKFLDERLSLVAVLIFSSNLVFSWQSTTAYVDLIRTFFEFMALWGFINFYKNREKKWLVESAVMLGLAIAVKLLSLGSIFIFLALIIMVEKKLTKNALIYLIISLLIPLPYFFFSFVNTGNPVYPLFSQFYKTGLVFNNPLNILRLADPISPIYLIFAPLIFLHFKKLLPPVKIIASYLVLALIIWYLTQGTGGGRFLLPYLPAFSVLVAIATGYLSKNLRQISIMTIILVSLVTIVYKMAANYKYIPVIFALESKDKFLSENLNFSFFNFYDSDSYFKNRINSSDKVLLYGFHNLYYVDFPFVDSSYVKKGERFNYIAVQNTRLPERFKFWKLIYINTKTHVELYSIGGQKWAY